MNKVVLIGRLTKDPELKYTPGDGTAICRITVAVARAFKKDETDFINCVAFGKTGETIAQYFTKGRQIALAGYKNWKLSSARRNKNVYNKCDYRKF